METSLYNIFKSKNATKLAKKLLQSSIRDNFIYDLKPACAFFTDSWIFSYF